MRSITARTLLLALAGTLVLSAGPAGPGGAQEVTRPRSGTTLQKGQFKLAYDERGLSALSHPEDPYRAEFLSPNGRLGDPAVRYRVGEGDWLDIYASERKLEADAAAGTLVYTDGGPGMPLKMVQTFATDGTKLDWTVAVETAMDFPVTIGDLAFAIPWRAPSGENPEAIFERSWTKHHFISGDGSFIYFVRPSGEAPYLVVTVRPGTRLEYSTSEGRGAYRVYVHSGLTGGRETRGTWRQAHTTRTLGPAGTMSSRLECGLRFQWARTYDEIRDILYGEGLFDVRVVPGMTVPEDLTARIALRTKARIEAIEPEFPEETRLTDLGEGAPGTRIYEVAFRRLGENLLTIRHDGGRSTVLEFFATEPLETLIKKRSRFITARQQHRDPSKWYDGLYSVYDMKNKVLRGPDDTDGFDFWWGYVLACDDPALCKAPYVASKNVHFPDAAEIASVEYYLEHFVWGKLQRSDGETNPYGIHGVPNWKVARDPVLRAGIETRNLEKMKIWRAYDYPHILMLYFHMYEIAEKYPGMTKYLDAAGYLERAFQTARAFYKYPYEILPWYEIYKWGYYNELVILDLIDALEREGRKADADALRTEWEKKVKYFVYDEKYPFRSEYAIDRTAFESSYALAEYGATHDMAPDADLWQDKRTGKRYSHPAVKREDSRAFMDRQLRAGLAVRGWIEPAYYLLGADFTASSDVGSLSYMANMGGWGVLDYGLDFAAAPWDWLQLGYASYLSSWALMNTGRAETGYGFWFPGAENDGATGWQFMTAKFGRAWIRKDVPRGAWHYDGEIDLGYGAGLRMAATVLADDPLFGWIAYGGVLTRPGNKLSVVPRDGLRQRFAAVAGKPAPLRVKIELDRDGFREGAAIETDESLKDITFLLENRTGDTHTTGLRLALPLGRSYTILQDGRPVKLAPAGNIGNKDYPWRAELRVVGPASKIEIVSK
jgi:hypothetical protein